MIANIVTGNFVSGMVRYNSKRCENSNEGRFLYSKNIIGGNTSKNIIQSISRRNSFNNSKKPNLHISLSFHPDDELTDLKMSQIAEEYMTSLGYEDSPMAVYRHLDKGHPHLHIVSTQIDPEGNRISDSQLFRRSTRLSRELELKYNITIATKSKEESILNNNVQSYLEGKSGLISVLNSSIENVLNSKPGSEKDYFNRLHRIGIDVTSGDNGYVYSVILEENENKKFISGSTIDAAYSTANITMLLKSFKSEKNKALPQIKAITHLILSSIDEPIPLDEMKVKFNKKGLNLEETRRKTGEKIGMINGFRIIRKKDSLQVNLSDISIFLKDILPLIQDNKKLEVEPIIKEDNLQPIIIDKSDSNTQHKHSTDSIIQDLLETSQNLVDIIFQDESSGVGKGPEDEDEKRKKRKKRKRRR